MGKTESRRFDFKGALDVVTTIVLLIVAAVVVWPRLRAAPERSANVAPSLPVPKSPISISGSPRKGATDAKFVLVEFSDFECPYCGRFARDTMPRLSEAYIDTGKLAFVFQHLPLSNHKNALPAAKAAECANRQAQFWPVHDWLFDQRSLSAGAGRTAAEAAGLDMVRFDACVSTEAGQKVDADARLAGQLSITGTPAFLFGSFDKNQQVQVISTISGARSFEDFQEMLKPVLQK